MTRPSGRPAHAAVVVVGAGLAGLNAARELTTAGVDVAVVEGANDAAVVAGARFAAVVQPFLAGVFGHPELATSRRYADAGDHRDTPSIQGALVSGRRAAQDVLARLPGFKRQ
jgi:monoamine oxidase